MTDRQDDQTPDIEERDDQVMSAWHDEDDTTSGPAWLTRAMDLAPRVLAAIGGVVLIGMIVLVGFRAIYSDKIYPQVVIGDVQVGGLTVDQAANKVEERAKDLNENSISFTYKGKTWTPKLSDVGATVDVDKSVDGAYALGRGDEATSRFDFTGRILKDGQTVPLKTVLDETKLEAWFDQVDKDINNPAINAGIIVKGNNEIEFTPESTGIVVDRAEAKKQIVASLDSLSPISEEIPTKVDHPRIEKADLEAGKGDVQRVLSRSVSVSLNDKKWTIKPQDVSQFLVVDAVPVPGQAPKILLSFDEPKLSDYLRKTYAPDINKKPVNAVVYFDGSLKASQPSEDGVTLMTDDFAGKLADSFIADHTGFELPVHFTKPAVDSNNLGALKIDSQLGRGDSNFEGGTAERDLNIEVGMQLLNGELVAPGKTFSFNHAVGAITTEAGFVESSVILGETIGTDIGGGICQVSTTAFRAALMGGFPMVDWHPHRYRISGYELDGWGPGFDASILQPDPQDPSTWGDFTFKNTTDSYILVQSWTSFPYAVVEIYGHDQGWKVEVGEASISEPIEPTAKMNMEIVDESLPPGTIETKAVPIQGYSISFHRLVTAKNGEVLSDRTFETYFEPHGYQTKVSPDMKGKSSGATGG